MRAGKDQTAPDDRVLAAPKRYLQAGDSRLQLPLSDDLRLELPMSDELRLKLPRWVMYTTERQIP